MNRGDAEEMDDAFELFVNDAYTRQGARGRQAAVNALMGIYRRWPRVKGRMLASVASLRS